MKFNKEKYKSSGRRPASGSEPRLRKKHRIDDPSTFQEWVPEEAQPSVQPTEAPAIETLATEVPQEATEEPSSTSAPPPVGTSPSSFGPIRVPNLLDDAGLTIRRMESGITQDDLARAHTLPPRALTKGIAHDLAKVLLFASELGTRYVKSNQGFVQEHKKGEALGLRVSELEAELKEAKAKAEVAEEDLTRALNAWDEALTRAEGSEAALAIKSELKQQAIDLAMSRRVQLENLEGRVEEEKARVVEAFKDGEEAQDWLAETYQEGFMDAKKDILKIYPDLDLSSVSALGGAEPEAPGDDLESNDEAD